MNTPPPHPNNPPPTATKKHPLNRINMYPQTNKARYSSKYPKNTKPTTQSQFQNQSLSKQQAFSTKMKKMNSLKQQTTSIEKLARDGSVQSKGSTCKGIQLGGTLAIKMDCVKSTFSNNVDGEDYFCHNRFKSLEFTKNVVESRQIQQEMDGLIEAVANKYQKKYTQIINQTTAQIERLNHQLITNNKLLLQKQSKIRQLSQIIEKYKSNGRQFNSPHRHSPQRSPPKIKINNKEVTPSRGIYNYEVDPPVDLAYAITCLKDLEAKLDLVVREIGKVEGRVKGKIQRLDFQIVQVHGGRVHKLKETLNGFIDFINLKHHAAEKSISKILFNSNSDDHQQTRLKFEELHLNLNNIRQTISMQSKQDNQKHQNIHKLQDEIELLKVGVINLEKQYLKKSCYKGGQSGTFNTPKSKNCFYDEDEDQFYYPPSERSSINRNIMRMYNSNDDYEHFQQDASDQEHEMPNRQKYLQNSLTKVSSLDRSLSNHQSRLRETLDELTKESGIQQIPEVKFDRRGYVVVMMESFYGETCDKKDVILPISFTQVKSMEEKGELKVIKLL